MCQRDPDVLPKGPRARAKHPPVGASSCPWASSATAYILGRFFSFAKASQTEGTSAFLKPISLSCKLSLIRIQRLKASMRIIFTLLRFSKHIDKIHSTVTVSLLTAHPPTGPRLLFLYLSLSCASAPSRQCSSLHPLPEPHAEASDQGSSVSRQGLQGGCEDWKRNIRQNYNMTAARTEAEAAFCLSSLFLYHSRHFQKMGSGLRAKTK